MVIRSSTHRLLWTRFAVLALLVGSACTVPSPVIISTPGPPTLSPGETELAFETIDKYTWAKHPYLKTSPAVVVVTSRQEIDARLDRMIQDRALEQLRNLDFGQYFALAVFRGHFASGCCGATIRRVGRRGDRLVVYAEFSQARAGRLQPAVENAPYHLVKVRRDGHPFADQDALLITWTVYY